MNELLQRLREFDALRDDQDGERPDVVATRTVPAVAPTYVPEGIPARYPPVLAEALHKLGVRRLYRHQVEAIDAILAGRDAVIEAPTATGKTLCFNIPLVLELGKDPTAHALMIHPMKALSNDQRRQFDELAAAYEGAASRRLDSWIFDGDTDPEHRKLLKENPPALLLTNPEMIQYSFLGWSEQWEGFLRCVRFLVVDEIHEYRGYFGTNVALLLRRLLAFLRQLGARPQVILATATCGNPVEHAARLTGRECVHVEGTDAFRPERHFAFIRPSIPDFHFHDIYRLRIARAALASVAHGLSTLVFTPSRRFAEETARQAKRDAENHSIDPEALAPYRSGFEAELRRDIEEGLRSGKYRAVFSTNALEIGVDIGRLDVCVLAGFPDSIFSAWQRVGRTGRSFDRTAYVLFYALNNPFDQFFAGNIDAFLNRPLDEILIGLDNEELMRRHVPFLLHETGGRLADDLVSDLGETFLSFARSQAKGVVPARHKPPYQSLSLRGGSGTLHRLTVGDRELGTVSEVHRFREAYVGGIYNHFGRAYRVRAHAADEVILENAEPHLRTEGMFWTVLQEGDLISGKRFGAAVDTCYGNVTVFENFGGYRLIDDRTREVISKEASNPIALIKRARAFWLSFEDLRALGDGLSDDGLVGLEQLLRIGGPFVIPCDRHDIGTLSRTQGSRAVFLYETVPGGIGIAEKALEVWPRLIETGAQIAERCACKNGCPSCVVPHRLSPGMAEPKKEPAVRAARALLEYTNNARVEVFDPELHAWRPETASRGLEQ